MADRIPVKARYAPGSPVDVVALQEFEPTDTIPLSIVSGFPLGVVSELANNSISALGDVDTTGSPAPSNGDVLTWNSTLSVWEHATPMAGNVVPYIILIGGNDMVVFDDSTRAGKTLSSETSNYSWGETKLSNSDWVRLSGVSDAQSGYVMPFNATIVSVAIQCENVNGNTKDINLYIDGINNGAIGQLSGSGEQIFTNTALNIDVAANSKLRMRAGTSGGDIQDTNIQLRVKWRV